MSIPLGPQTTSVDCCNYLPGTRPPPDIAPYVVSLNDLNGIITLDGQGAIDITSSGNTILFSLSASAGLGTVTSVGLSSTSLTVANSPITTVGTMTVNLTGATASIQNLVTAADKMIYTTASNVYATTDLTAFARTLLDDAAAVNARSTLGLVIGTNVQAWSADLDSLVTNTSWVGANVTFAGNLSAQATTVTGLTCAGNIDLQGSGSIIDGDSATFASVVTAASFSGSGATLTSIPASAITTGTLAVARGGTNIGSYAVGDILYASGATTLSKLADVAAGSFLRSGGVTTAPAWSTTTWPNTLATGDLLYASSTTAVSRLADVATGNAVISGGVGVAPSWGKITTSHTTGIAASGNNSDITALNSLVSITSDIAVGGIEILGALTDATSSPGSAGQVLVSNVTGVLWTSQVVIDALTLNTSFSADGTITSAGTTGARTINKMSGTVRFAAAATSLVVTNSLATTVCRVLATVCTNDATMKAVQAVVTTGAFTLFPDAAPTAETEVYFMLVEIT